MASFITFYHTILNHIKFNRLKYDELAKPRIKKINDVNKISISKITYSFTNMNRIRKTKEKVIPKFLFDGMFVILICTII